MNIVECENFSMLNMSLSMIFGKSPKIKYLCGKCGRYNEGRLNISEIYWEVPYLDCKYCGTTNKIPITIDEEGNEY